MKIKSLELTNYRCFHRFSIDFERDLTVLVAKNGNGKTSILDAISICLGAYLTKLPKVKGIGFKDTDFLVYPDRTKPAYMRVACESYSGIRWDLSKFRDSSKKTKSGVPSAKGLSDLHAHVDRLLDLKNEKKQFELPVFIYYGTGRGVFDIPQRKKGFSHNFDRLDSFVGSLESRTNFRRFVEYFYYLEGRESKLQKEKKSFDVQLPELKAIRLAISKMFPDFSNPQGDYPASIVFNWKRGGTEKTLRIEQLSDGFRTTLAMGMDIAARMAEANPEMENPLETSGVVLIDEVDLHLHPGWQQTILTELTQAFPNVQFIVSTHSPQVVSSVRPDSLRVIEWKGEEASLQPVLFSEGAESQQMLLEVLGVESLRPPGLEIVKDLIKYQEFVAQDDWDNEEAIILRRKLDEWGKGHEPELMRLEMDIRLKKLDRADEKH